MGGAGALSRVACRSSLEATGFSLVGECPGLAGSPRLLPQAASEIALAIKSRISTTGQRAPPPAVESPQLDSNSCTVCGPTQAIDSSSAIPCATSVTSSIDTASSRAITSSGSID